MKVLSVVALLASAISVSAGDFDTQVVTCLPRGALEAIVPKYIAAFSGITDGGKAAKSVFMKDFQMYSQSVWWTSGRPDIVKAHSKADDFPPIFKNRDEMVKGNIKDKTDPNAFQHGPVAYGCNTFSFYWKGNFQTPGLKQWGRTNGIDIVFLNYQYGKVSSAYSEYNTLNQLYNLGSHVTWSDNPTCCECATPFDPKCKCPAATC
ncbi:Fc.00g008790.m01.CDS01 [Cosmosporella sp. VM-42]